MTSLVIVGNGFDLFHHLPTSYKEYKSTIEDFFSSLYALSVIRFAAAISTEY